MKKTVKLEKPQINEWIFIENDKVGYKQDGLKKNEILKYHISELSPLEAEEYAEEYKKVFLEKYHQLKK